MTEPALLRAVAEAVAILWDEAQERPALLRFLAPFGRPDLHRLETAFRNAPSVDWLLGEPWPLFGTWLAAAVVRLELELPKRTSEPRLNEFFGASTTRAQGLVLHADRSLVVAGDLTAPSLAIEAGARLAVAGTVKVGTLVSRGVVLVQRVLDAHTVVIAEGRPDPQHRGPPRHVGWQVGERVIAQVLDSPRFALPVPLECDGVVRLAGRPADLTQQERARTRTSAALWAQEGLDVEAMLQTFGARSG